MTRPLSCRPLHRIPPTAGAVILLLAGHLGAQQFMELPTTEGPAPFAWSRAIAAGDVDGDGDADVVVGGAQRDHLYLNDGNGGFVDVSAAQSPFVQGEQTSWMQLVDVDVDGDLDLILIRFPYYSCSGSGGGQGWVRLHLNDGNGTFADVSATQLPTTTDIPNAIAVADVDGDGDEDLAIGTWRWQGRGNTDAGQSELWLNNGAGTFVDATAARFPAPLALTHSLVFTDVDGDGDVDLVMGNEPYVTPAPSSGPGDGVLMINDGSGFFTDATAGRLPPAGLRTVVANDIDGDGDADLIFGSSASGRARLYANDGTGTFADVTAARLPAQPFGSIRTEDVDLDGDDDLFADGQLLINDGQGAYAQAPTEQFSGGSAGVLAIADADGDGLRDLFFATGMRFENGGGFYARVRDPRLDEQPQATDEMVLADVDGDGDADLVTAGSGSRVHLNDGDGTFVTQQLDWTRTSSVAVGDVDGDGDVDLAFGVAYGFFGAPTHRFFVNDGSGGFSAGATLAAPATARAERVNAVALADVDGDGDLDMVSAVGHNTLGLEQNLLHLNDGTGTFTRASAGRLPAMQDASIDVSAGDFDGDGDVDLLFANYGQQDRLYLNDGTGTFVDATATHLPSDTANSRRLALGDVDGDGVRDLVIGVDGGQDRLLLGAPNGVFVDATGGSLPQGSMATTAVALGDLDGDGDLDLLLGSNNYASDLLALVNTGSGVFSDATARLLPVTGEGASALALADIDADGDLDIARGFWLRGAGSSSCSPPPTRPDRIFLNRLRQLRTPRLLKLGEAYDVEVHAVGGGAVTHIAVSAMSPSRQVLPIPGVGILALDPLDLVELPWIAIRPGSGFGTTSVTVPSQLNLAGLSFTTQAVVLGWRGRIALTNATTRRVLR